MADNRFSIGEAYKFAWNTFWGRPFFWVLIFLFSILLESIPRIFYTILPEEALISRFIVSIIYFIFVLLAGMGLVTLALKAARLEKVEFLDYFSKFNLFVPYLWAYILYFLAVFFGFILLIIPGIIFAMKYCFWPYFVIDGGSSGLTAIKESNLITYGRKWHILLFTLATIGVNILGALCLGIGLLVSLPMTALAWAYVYTQLYRPTTEEVIV